MQLGARYPAVRSPQRKSYVCRGIGKDTSLEAYRIEVGLSNVLLHPQITNVIKVELKSLCRSSAVLCILKFFIFVIINILYDEPRRPGQANFGRSRLVRDNGSEASRSTGLILAVFWKRIDCTLTKQCQPGLRDCGRFTDIACILCSARTSQPSSFSCSIGWLRRCSPSYCRGLVRKTL
jgi:hypothetical protein